jgi:hypothetical protein
VPLFSAVMAIQVWAPARADDDSFWTVSGLVAPEIWPAFAVLSDLGAESILQLYEAPSVSVH